MNDLNIFHGEESWCPADLRRALRNVAPAFAAFAQGQSSNRGAQWVGDMNHPQMVQDGKTMGKPWENGDLYGKSPFFMGKYEP